MKQILVIDVSLRGAESASRRVAKVLTDSLQARSVVGYKGLAGQG
jgi:FMN-dependent NADH-azoreductase